MSNRRVPMRMLGRSAGVTLVELIIAMVIIAAALGGLVAAFSTGNRASADPLILQQKVAIAESLMGEILLRPYGLDTTAYNPVVRDTFVDVRDFDGYGKNLSGIRDARNNPIPGLESYNVSVSVPLDDTASPLRDATPNLKITITVTYKMDTKPEDAFVLTGWRTPP